METVLDGSYQPLARPIFIYVNTKSLAAPEVKEFVEYYLTHGAKLAREVKYVPLPAEAYSDDMEHLAKMAEGHRVRRHAEVGVHDRRAAQPRSEAVADRTCAVRGDVLPHRRERRGRLAVS